MQATGRRGRQAGNNTSAEPTGASGITINAEMQQDKPVDVNITEKKETINEPQISIKPQRRNLDDNPNDTQIPNDGVISGSYGDDRRRRRGEEVEIDLDKLCACCCEIF